MRILSVIFLVIAAVVFAYAAVAFVPAAAAVALVPHLLHVPVAFAILALGCLGMAGSLVFMD